MRAKLLTIAGLAAAAVALPAASFAGTSVGVSIGIGGPPVAYYPPPPVVYYPPPPVAYYPPPVAVFPRPYYYAPPATVVFRSGPQFWGPGWHGHGGWHGQGGWRGQGGRHWH